MDTDESMSKEESEGAAMGAVILNRTTDIGAKTESWKVCRYSPEADRFRLVATRTGSSRDGLSFGP